MKKSQIALIIGAVIVTVAAITVTMFALQKPTSKTTPASQKSGESTMSTHEADQNVTITYTDKGFLPASYMIKTGGTVTVINQSSRDLEFSSNNHPAHTDEAELNMDTLAPGKSGTFTVTKVGTWGFHNHLTPDDTGSLMVM